MPLYNYHAIDKQGKKRKGLVDAHSEADAKGNLREKGLMVTSLQVKTGAVSKENLKGEGLATFTLQLSQLVGAGVPVYESLIALEEQYRDEPFDRVILSLCEKIKAGTPLSEAMAEFPDTFDRLYCSMITAGESAGALDIVLEKLSDLLIKQDKLKKDIMTAMIYPAILASFSLIVIAMLVGFVIPSIEGIFADRKLNKFTEFVIGFSHFARNWWWIYMPAISGIVVWFVFKIRTPAGKIWLERMLLKLPIIRTMLIQAAVARFTRTMGTLLKGGLTIIDSLRIAREVMRNATLEEEIRRAEGRIVEGSSLSTELSKSRLIPHMVSKMLAVGEESGTTVVMLNKIADMYEQHLEKTLQRIMALAQPVILIVMGTIIGSVLISILLPLTDMSSFRM